MPSERVGHNCINRFYFIAHGAIIPVTEDDLGRGVKSHRQGVHKRDGEGIRIVAFDEAGRVGD